MRKGLIAGLLLLLVAVAGAWQVFDGILADVTGNVLKAEARVTSITVSISDIKSGYDFEATVTGEDAIVISNAKELAVTINVAGLEEEINAGDFQSCYVNVVVYDEQGSSVLEGTIDALNPAPLTGTLPEGTYDVQVTVYGTAGYPENPAPIDFDVVISIDTPQ